MSRHQAPQPPAQFGVGTETNSQLGIRIRRSAGSHLVELVCKGGMAVLEAALKRAGGDSTEEPEAGSPRKGIPLGPAADKARGLVQADATRAEREPDLAGVDGAPFPQHQVRLSV